MNISDVMRSSYASVKSSTSLYDAVALMGQTRQRGLPVVDDNQYLVGFLSEGDLLRRAGRAIEPRSGNWLKRLLGAADGPAEGDNIDRIVVGDLMNRNPIAIDIDASLDDAVAQMDSHNIAHMPVTCGESVVGFLSRIDVLAAVFKTLQERSSSSAPA